MINNDKVKMNQTLQTADILKFKNKHHAKKWGAKEFKNWSKNHLTKEEIQNFKTLWKFNHRAIFDLSIIQNYLNVFKGDLLEVSDQNSEKFITDYECEINHINRQIIHNDVALERTSIPARISIFRWIQEDNYGLIANFDFLMLKNLFNPRTLESKRVQELFNILPLGSIWPKFEYAYGSLVPSLQDERNAIPILLEYQIAQGTKGAYIGTWSHQWRFKPRIVISRHQKFTIADLKVINQNGNEYIKIVLTTSHDNQTTPR